MDSKTSDALEKTFQALCVVEDVHNSLAVESSFDKFLSTLNSEPQCQMNVALAYALESLWFVYLRVKGKNPHSEQVIQDLERVKKYIAKVKAATRTDMPSTDTRTSKIDRSAATRFIRHGLNENLTAEQKHSLDKLSGRTVGMEEPSAVADDTNASDMDTTSDNNARAFLDSILDEQTPSNS